eukprot:COSAG02_NODE_36322_length_456_cov_0.792717_2_plen_21_part_01
MNQRSSMPADSQLGGVVLAVV